MEFREEQEAFPNGVWERVVIIILESTLFPPLHSHKFRPFVERF